MAEQAADIWAEMRLHMEWSEGFSLCVLFAPSASATEGIARWADDAWAWRTAPMTRLNPAAPKGAAQALLRGLQDHSERWGSLRAPVWMSLLAQDSPGGQNLWDVERATLLGLLNESREWLLREFACPLVVSLPTTWAARVAALAPDLWHVRAYTAEVAATPQQTTTQVGLATTQGAPEQALTTLREAVLDARARANAADPLHHTAAQRELVVALGQLSAQSLLGGQLSEAHGAASDSVALMRQLRQALGDSPQVLRDLSVSLDNLGDAEEQAGRGEAALAAYRESLDIFRQLRQALGDSPQVLDDLAVSLERLGSAEPSAPTERLAMLDEAVALREHLVIALPTDHHQQRLLTARAQRQRVSLAASTH